jgi:Carboxypeptidase regulatory-like domain
LKAHWRRGVEEESALRRAFLFALSLLVVALACARASACGCLGKGTPCEAFGGAEAVFVGTVASVKEGARSQKPGGELEFTPRLVRFTVEQSFLGPAVAETEIATGLGGFDCGYPFAKGATYLVYAYKTSEKDETLYTSTCSRTTPVARADEDLAYLRGLGGPAYGFTVFAKVIRFLSYPGPDRQRPLAPMEGASLSLEGAGRNADARSDSQGQYRFAGLRPGEYKLRLQLPDELIAYRPERAVKAGQRGCASEVFYVGDNGRVSGRITDPEGKPVANLGVVIIDATGTSLEMSGGGAHAKTDEDGRYSFKGLPAGEYLMGVNVRGLPRVSDAAEQSKAQVCNNCVQLADLAAPEELTSAYPRLFYPGVTSASKSAHVYLSPGQELRDVNWTLPPRRAEAFVRGRVVWDDGSAAAGAEVLYREATYEDLLVYKYAVRADEHGEFSFKAYAGGRYILEGFSNTPDPPGWRGPGPAEYPLPSTVIVNAPTQTVTVVIRRLTK